MGQTRKSTDELLKELAEAVLRVQELERLLLDSTHYKALLRNDEILQQPHSDTVAERDSFDSTQTFDLTSLFSQDVTASGSYCTEGIGVTPFGRLIEARPASTLSISGPREVVFGNRAWGGTSSSYENVTGRRFAYLFPVVSVAEDVDALAESVFTTGKVFVKEAVLAVDDRQIWGRLTIRSARLGPYRPLLVPIEDLTPQKRQLLQRGKCRDALKHEIDRRKTVEQALKES